MKKPFKFSKDVLSFKEGDIKPLPYSTILQLTYYGYGQMVDETKEQPNKRTRKK